MKKYFIMMGAWVALATLSASGQTSSSGNSQGTSSSSQGATSGSQGNLPPGLENRNQLPPGLQNREQLPPGLAKRTNEVSNFGATNQFGGTSRFGTNNSGLNPTGRSGDTNRLYGTNGNLRGGSSSYGTNRGSFGSAGTSDPEGNARFQDEAVTASDRTLLVNVRQTVQTQVRALTTTSAGGAWMPVHFRIQNGVVTLIGVVQTIEIQQQIEACVRRVPGVVRVEDTIEIGAVQGGGGDTDDVLLTRVRESVLPQIQVGGIDFQCHGGVVTVIGSVPQQEQKERLVSLVRQVPGVVNVTDQVTINAGVTGRPESGQVESRPDEANRAVNAAVETSRTNNLTPTGRTNSSLPPGLENRQQLPPGLQNREQLPPGLSKRTNDATQPNP